MLRLSRQPVLDQLRLADHDEVRRRWERPEVSLWHRIDGNPESCVPNGSGSIYVGQPDGTKDILKFSLAGDAQGSFNPGVQDRGTDWIDLASDDCTMYYTSEGTSVKRFNVCTNTQLSDFATGLPGSAAYALRLLPGGGAILADTEYIVRLDPSGNVVKTYPASDYGTSSFLFALNLDPDGKTFWTADYTDGKITRIDIDTGDQVSSSPPTRCRRWRASRSSGNAAGTARRRLAWSRRRQRTRSERGTR